MNRLQRCVCSLMTGLASILLAGPASTAPVARLSWVLCPFMQSHMQIYPGGFGAVYVWVTGLEEAHCGYRATLEISAPDGAPIPDAWRFEAGGCQEGWLFIHRGPPVVPNSCGDPVRSPRDSLVWHQGATYDETIGIGHVNLDAEYVPCETNVEAGRGYTLGIFSFYFQNAVVGTSGEGTCGGLSRGICIRLSEVSYRRTDGIWVPIDSQGAYLTGSLSPEPGFVCFETDAAATSWGRIKSAYHR